jgi:hypothetical protein
MGELPSQEERTDGSLAGDHTPSEPCAPTGSQAQHDGRPPPCEPRGSPASFSQPTTNASAVAPSIASRTKRLR